MDEEEIRLFHDAQFRRKVKNGDYEVVDAPILETFVADTHAHLHLLPDPALALARAAVHRVSFIEMIVDVVEDGDAPFEKLDDWLADAVLEVRNLIYQAVHHNASAGERKLATQVVVEGGSILSFPRVPQVRICVGCHPHNAKDYDAAAEQRLIDRLEDRRVSALGEIGLDYHYDFSPRDIQKEVFRRQLNLAQEHGLPVVLHIRDAHDDAFEILEQEGFSPKGTILHCYTLGPEELKRWVDAGCYIAFGGALTFKKADDLRAAAELVPEDRLLTETDAPYMTPEPMRGIPCEPADVVFTAARLAVVRQCSSDKDRVALLDRLYDNAIYVLNRPRY